MCAQTADQTSQLYTAFLNSASMETYEYINCRGSDRFTNDDACEAAAEVIAQAPKLTKCINSTIEIEFVPSKDGVDPGSVTVKRKKT